MGSKLGVIKAAAARLGLLLQEYAVKHAAGLKWCIQCRKWKPTTNFVKDKTRSDGLASSCRECRNIRITAGPGKTERQQMRKAGLAWCRRCQDWHPADVVSRGICRSHANEEARKRYATDRHYRLKRRQHAKRRKRGVAPIPPEAQDIILEEFNGVCAYCGALANTWDHIVPVTKGGPTTPGNVVPACTSCNSSKKHKEVFEWLQATGKIPCDQFFDRLILAECGLYG